MILVTGASGFIGRHLLRALIAKFGAENVVALTSAPIEDCRFLLHHDYNISDRYVNDSGYPSIDAVIHAGAFTPKNADQAGDWKQCNRNISNTGILLSNLSTARKLIFLSTLDVYANADLISEESPVAPVSLYGYSKLYCEKMVESWARTNGKIAQVLRVGHVYGPGEEAYSKIIPATFHRLLKGDDIQMWGTGKELRSFIYIEDLVTAIVNALELPEAAGPINVVGGTSISVKALLDKIISVSGVNAVIEELPAQSASRNLVFDNAKMTRLLFDRSETSLDDGLLAEWHYMKQLKR